MRHLVFAAALAASSIISGCTFARNARDAWSAREQQHTFEELHASGGAAASPSPRSFAPASRREAPRAR